MIERERERDIFYLLYIIGQKVPPPPRRADRQIHCSPVAFEEIGKKTNKIKERARQRERGMKVI